MRVIKFDASHKEKFYRVITKESRYVTCSMDGPVGEKIYIYPFSLISRGSLKIKLDEDLVVLGSIQTCCGSIRSENGIKSLFSIDSAGEIQIEIGSLETLRGISAKGNILVDKDIIANDDVEAVTNKQVVAKIKCNNLYVMGDVTGKIVANTCQVFGEINNPS